MSFRWNIRLSLLFNKTMRHVFQHRFSRRVLLFGLTMTLLVALHQFLQTPRKPKPSNTIEMEKLRMPLFTRRPVIIVQDKGNLRVIDLDPLSPSESTNKTHLVAMCPSLKPGPRTKSYSLPSPLRDHVFEYEEIRSTSRFLKDPKLVSNYLAKLNRTAVEDFFRDGHSLGAYTTENGDQGWIENGVIYKPFPKTFDRNKSAWISPSGFTPYVPFDKERFFFGDERKMKEFASAKEKRKIIYFQRLSRYMRPADNVRPIETCPDFPCGITTNKKYENQSAAMVFDAQLISGNPPNRTSPDQVFVFHIHEPPFGRYFVKPVFREKRWNGIFNWTMSYRMDSDIISLYGILRKRPKPLQKNYTQILAQKKKFAAWIVGNCGTPGKRREYVKRLQKYIHIDIFGKCGKNKCPRSSDDSCTNRIATNYKFYLSFENSFCPDYITEKFFKQLPFNIISVARASNEYYQHAPSEIFINTADYPSPQKLAQKLLHLDKHPDQYINMLKEKDKYMQMYEDYPIFDKNGTVFYHAHRYEEINYCEMCQKLWNLENEAKTIPSLNLWFQQKLCREPTDIK